MGYLLDICWKRTTAEKNLFRFALFVSFFPQIMQGPIGRYSKLAHQLYEEHSFSLDRFERGFQRILWGFFKKMVIADNALYFVNPLFKEYQTYDGVALFATVFYAIQLYMDFSGGIYVVIGIADLFGVTMDENFRQPYFAVSITDFWHRWHITLGTWMKDYVFYPISLSGWMGSFRKWCRKHLPKQTARALPVAIANILVFLVVGVWHGAAWKYIVYGLYNGIIIGFSELMAVSYKNAKTRLHINDKSRGWKVFMVLRTFLLVNISWFFDNAKTVPQAFAMMRNAVTHFTPSLLLTVPVGPGGSTSFTKYALTILAFACIVLFVVSLLTEKGVNIPAYLLQRPFLVRIFVYLLLLIMLPALGQPPVQTGGFIYAQF
jgi:D-alanyl-lipoteichoic acid acyltransferase DltB (MBOAT superfamily)